jgi:hypothetical protein
MAEQQISVEPEAAGEALPPVLRYLRLAQSEVRDVKRRAFSDLRTIASRKPAMASIAR